jgi:hypothetical protein
MSASPETGSAMLTTSAPLATVIIATDNRSRPLKFAVSVLAQSLTISSSWSSATSAGDTETIAL